MSLTDIEIVRLRSSDKSIITRESATGDGQAKYYKLAHAPILSTPALEVRLNNVLQTLTTHYTVDLVQGIVTFISVPAVNDEIEFTYYWSIFTDAEVQYFLDDAGSNTTIATAKLLLAIAADASKVAQRQSLAGGGGLGAVTLDTSVTARELRNTAKALIEMEADIGTSIPAEGITEPVWTEAGYRELLEQHVVRES